MVTVRIAVRCIYWKPVTPSCDILFMEQETWDNFRFGDKDKRKEIVLKLLGKEDMSSYIKEIVWIPLDGQKKLLIAPGFDPTPPEFRNKKIKRYRKGKTISKEEYSKRVFEKFRRGCCDEHGNLRDKERFDECIEKHFDDYLEDSYNRYILHSDWKEASEDMTWEAYTEATIDQCVSCLDLEY